MRTYQKESLITVTGPGEDQKSPPEMSYESQELIEMLPAAVYACDKEGRITFYNKAAAVLWGRNPRIGKDLWCGSWKIYQPDGTPLILDACPMAITLKEGVAVKGHEIIIERPDGVRVNVLPHPQPLFDTYGKITGAFNMLVDITGKKAAEDEIRESEKKYRELARSLEEKVEKRTLELKKQNEELEQYAYIASHDLQEPLRKIQTFTELLEKDIDDKKEVKKNLEKISTSAKRMTSLIKDVLKYSQLSKTDELFTYIDLNKVLEGVTDDFELLIEEKQLKINHTDLPVIKGIDIQIHQLFSNLIGNAIKFTNENPVIEITSEKLLNGEIKKYPGLSNNQEYIKIIFTDNGHGFDPQYTDQVFKLFKRLSHTEQGTGIGLALCKKIVENHHGHISVSSEINKGTSFTLIFPVS